MSTTWQNELACYEAVVFLEATAVAALSIADGNAVRREDHRAARAIDQRLRDVWKAHAKFSFVPCQPDFAAKIEHARCALIEAIDPC